VNYLDDQLVLGIKGTMSEAELHLLRVRLRGGITNVPPRAPYRRLPGFRASARCSTLPHRVAARDRAR
jgi:hypothetical protein